MTYQLCLVRGVSVLFARYYTVIISTVMVSSLFFALSTFPNEQWPAMFSPSRELVSLPFACALLLGVRTLCPFWKVCCCKAQSGAEAMIFTDQAVWSSQSFALRQRECLAS